MTDIAHDARTPAAMRANTLAHALDQVATPAATAWCWEALAASATLVITPKGQPIRTIITGRRRITTGSYASRKAGRAFPFEGMNERAFLMHSEVHTSVVDYRAQPFRFEFVLDGQKRTYIADAVRLLDDGAVEVVEIKNDRRFLKDPEYALKLDAVAVVCRQIGWRFRIIYRADLFEPATLFDNVQDVQSWRLANYGQADVFRVLDRLEAFGSQAIGSLADLIDSRPVGMAKLKAMMVGRIVRIDLSEQLSIDSEVGTVTSPTAAARQEAVQ
jgi:hypothetical protein